MNGLFPYDKQELLINIPKEDLVRELRKNIQVNAYVPFFKDKKSKRFYGSTTSETWKVILKTSYRNSFKPVIRIKLLPHENKTKMILEFRLHIAVKVFIILFLIIPVSIIVDNLLNQNSFEEYYFPIGIIVFSFILSYAGFYMSLDHSANALNRILRKVIANARKT